MKKIIALLAALCLLLCGCSELIPARTTVESEQARLAAQVPPTTEPITLPTQEPTTEPPTEPPTEPAPQYFNPLNGEPMNEPFNKRIFALSSNNIRYSVPHSNVLNADLYF